MYQKFGPIRLLVPVLVLLSAKTVDARPFNLEYEWRAFSARTAAREITAKELTDYELVLTSDSLGGRETATPYMWKTAHYLAHHFKKIGLEQMEGAPDYLYRYPVMVKTFPTPPKFAFINGTDTLLLTEAEEFRFMPFAIDSSTKSSDSLVFIGYGIDADSLGYNDYSGVSVQNKIAVFFSGEPVDSAGISLLTGKSDSPYGSGRAKRKHLRELGAAGSIEISLPDTGQTFNEQTKWLERYSKGNHVSLPVDTTTRSFLSFTVSLKAVEPFFKTHQVDLAEIRQALDQNLKPHSFVLSELASYEVSVLTKPDTAVNVIGMLPGTDPVRAKEAVMVTAHFDHLGIIDGEIYRGADDNASGTSVVMAIASAFSHKGAGPRTQIFMLVSGEEKGLLGSEYYSEHPLWPLDRVTAEVNIDMIGRNAPDSIYVIGSDMLSHDLDNVIHTAVHWSRGIHLSMRYNSKDDPNRFYFRSDHYNFAKHDIPSVFYFSGVHEDYHKTSDTMDKLDFGKMERVSRMVYLTTRTLNSMRHRPRLYTTDAAVK